MREKSERKMTETTPSTAPNPNPNLGDDVLCDILSRIPAKVLQQFKLVSKHWQSLINDPQFVDLHFSRSKTRLLIHQSCIYEDDSNQPILFSITDLFDGGKAVVPLKNLDLGCHRNRFRIFKPVNGLVCLKGGGNSVLIFNPFTGHKTSWIETSITMSWLSLVGENIDEDIEIEIRYKFGFGFEPTSKKHKVICISEICIEKEEDEDDDEGFRFGDDPLADHRVCEVLIVGENIWRKIDEVPPPYDLRSESLQVNGVIYWVDKNYPRPKVIVAFDLKSEKFRVIKTPGNYYERVSLKKHLIEVDGCMGLLDSVSKDINLLRFDEDSDRWIDEEMLDSVFKDINLLRFDEDSDKWINEEIRPSPFPWDGKQHLSFQALAETDLLLLQSFSSYPPQKLESLWCYDRKNKSSSNVIITCDSSFPVSRCGYEITTFMESLFPVKN